MCRSTVSVRVLRVSGFPILLQLRIEEALYRCSEENWLVVNEGVEDVAIVLGLSGKPEKHVNISEAHKKGVPLIKRFTGGGTVIVDQNTILTSLIFSKDALKVSPFPGPIMGFAAQVQFSGFR
jgi:lipoate-protein ligase A